MCGFLPDCNESIGININEFNNLQYIQSINTIFYNFSEM